MDSRVNHSASDVAHCPIVESDVEAIATGEERRVIEVKAVGGWLSVLLGEGDYG